MTESLRTKLLVATPPLVDENFDRTVVWVLEHSAEGALGVVLNRPGEREVRDALERWAPYVAPPGVLFTGGPVEPGAIIGLARGMGEPPSEHWAPLLDDIGTVDLLADPTEIDREIDALRLFQGYAGWGPGQLEQEIAAGAWIVVEARPDDPFSDDPANLWRRVLARQGGRLAWLANFPDDVSMN